MSAKWHWRSHHAILSCRPYTSNQTCKSALRCVRLVLAVDSCTAKEFSVRAKIEEATGQRPHSTVLYAAMELDERRLIWEHRDQTDTWSEYPKGLSGPERLATMAKDQHSASERFLALTIGSVGVV